jgi:hypothetical protein
MEELSSWIPKVPLIPFSGAKNVTIPLLPAGQATIILGEMMLRLLSG